MRVPKGFLFSAVEAAIKKPGRRDLALIYSEEEATMAGVFTSNAVKAAPVRLDMRRIQSGRGQAIIVNSGNANACTGENGTRDAREMARLIADRIRVKPSRVYVCSTGVIGVPLPMDRIRSRVDDLVAGLGRSSIYDVAAAMMTTDTFPKVIAKSVRIGGKTGVIAGVCKGAGMISPRMATMLCFLMTDLAVRQKTLRDALKTAVRATFNRITVDGDMSTNDTVLMMANGMLGNPRIGQEDARLHGVFYDALREVCEGLATLIVRDGEGATKLVSVEVRGARNDIDAEKAAFSVANSNLVKTALYGNDANWGRVMAALGYSGAKLLEEKVDIFFGDVQIVKGGISTRKEEEAGRVLRNTEVALKIDLHVGRGSAKVLTCDLSEEYVKVNAAYRT